MGVHASLGASSAERWMNCPGSVKRSDGLPDTTSAYAHEGTCAHYLGEVCLTQGEAPKTYVGQILTLPKHDQTKGFAKDFEVTKDMAMCVAVYVDFCNALVGDSAVEEFLDYSRWTKRGEDEEEPEEEEERDGFGTGDYRCFVDEEGTLHIVDLKYGQGIKVYAKLNKQMMLYGLGAYDNISIFEDVRKISMTIVQPRLDHIDTFEMITRDLLKFGEEVKLAAKATRQKDAPLIAGEKQCQWCKVKNTDEGCPAFDAFLVDDALDGFDIFAEDKDDLDPAEHLKNAPMSRLEKIIRNSSMVQKVLSGAREKAEKLLNEGQRVQGLKLVKGRGSRKWVEPDAEIERKLKNKRGIRAADVVEKKLISPAKAEKLLGKGHKFIKDYVEKIDGKPVVAPEDDPREAIDVTADATEGFDLD